MTRNNSRIYLIILIVAVSAGLLFYRLSDLMSFFGDQGWFYISARDMLLTGNIPLVGIASSHPWLHQGPVWTYTLAIIFSLTHFNPLAPGYFSAGLGVITVCFVYLVGKRMFSVTTGLIAAFLYATSPLVIITMREPYHTSFIPLFVLAFIYVLYKWLSGNRKYFPVSILLVACLYNFEISTTPFTLILILSLAFGIWKKQKYTTLLANKKILITSFFAWLIPMMPMLFYDRTHGFPQTIKFVLWLGYRFARLFGYPDIHNDTVFAPLAPFLPFTFTKLQDLLFLPQETIAVVLFIVIFIINSYFVYHSIKAKKTNTALIPLYLCFIVPFGGYIALQTSSDAYWPMLFPASILVFAVVFEKVFMKKRFLFIGVIFLLLLGGLNAYTLVKNSYLMTYNNYGYPFDQRLTVAKKIITQAKGKKYTIMGKGAGSKFPSFITPYTYLTWSLGHGPSTKPEKLKFIVTENKEKIILTQKND
jgi:hypothetical protein